MITNKEGQDFFIQSFTQIVNEETEAFGVFFWLTSQYNQDYDGFGDSSIDCIIALHSGIATHTGDVNCFGNAAANHSWSQGHKDENLGITVSNYVISSAFYGN